MSNIEISDSQHLKIGPNNEDNEIGEIYGDKGYSKIPLDQINLNTEPISINNDFNNPFFDTNIKSYVIILFVISILSGHFHYESNQKEGIKEEDLNKNININVKPENEIITKNQIIHENILNMTINNNKTIELINENKKIKR